MTDSRVEVLPVPEGSIIWLHNIAGADEKDGFLPTEMLDALRERIGHDRFAILTTAGDGVVEVLGEDELVARVRAALDGPPVECGMSRTGPAGVVYKCISPAGHSGAHLAADGHTAFLIKNEDG